MTNQAPVTYVTEKLDLSFDDPPIISNTALRRFTL